MGSNRFNKPAPAQYQPRDDRKKEKEVEIPLNLKPCLNCGKAVTTGYYAHYNTGGVCSKKCDSSYVKPDDGRSSAVPVTSLKRRDRK